MKKLCLILTVLYAIWANCSAQSLNIATNLLTGDNSTFDSGMGSWTCNDNNACSIDNANGKDGYYLKLKHTGEVKDYEKQMEYDLKGKGLTPAKGTRYVIKFWARKVSGSGQIKVLLQKNEHPTYPQQAFNGMNDINNPFTVSNDWKHYEFDITANKGDYEVIKINFGNCGEVWIDDIEYGEYSVPATGVTLNKKSASVKKDGTIKLTATVAPADATNKNVTWSSDNESVATVSDGVVTGVATGTAQITATTVDGNHTASCTVTVTTSLPPLLISDFENTDDISGIIYPNVKNPDKDQHIYIDLIDAPIVGGKCVAISD